MKEYEITDTIEPGADPGAMPNWMDLVRYGAIVGEIINTLKALGSIAMGAVIKLQTIKVRLGSGEWEWQMGEISRKK